MRCTSEWQDRKRLDLLAFTVGGDLLSSTLGWGAFTREAAFLILPRQRHQLLGR